MVSVADYFSGGDDTVFRWLLNLTGTRVLYSLYRSFRGTDAEKESAARSATDVKLFEAVFEAAAQLVLQMIALLFYSGKDQCFDPTELYVSMAIGVGSNAVGITAKFLNDHRILSQKLHDDILDLPY